MCFGLFVSAFIRLVLQVIRQKCKRRNYVSVCVCTGDQTQEPSVPEAGNCSLFSREIGCRYEEALGAMSGTYCFIRGLCQRCLPSPASWAGGSATGMSRCCAWAVAQQHIPQRVFPLGFTEVRDSQLDECPRLWHCPVWVLGLPLQPQVPLGSLAVRTGVKETLRKLFPLCQD